MNISLPDPMKEFIEEVVMRGDYSSVSEYIRALVREDRKRQEKERLEAILLEGLGSGPLAEMTPADWESIRVDVRQRLAERQCKADSPVQSDDR